MLKAIWFEKQHIALIAALVMVAAMVFSLVRGSIALFGEEEHEGLVPVVAMVFNHFPGNDDFPAWSDMEFRWDGRAYTVRQYNFRPLNQNVNLLINPDEPLEDIMMAPNPFDLRTIFLLSTAVIFGFFAFMYFINFNTLRKGGKANVRTN